MLIQLACIVFLTLFPSFFLSFSVFLQRFLFCFCGIPLLTDRVCFGPVTETRARLCSLLLLLVQRIWHISISIKRHLEIGSMTKSTIPTSSPYPSAIFSICAHFPIDSLTLFCLFSPLFFCLSTCLTVRLFVSLFVCLPGCLLSWRLPMTWFWSILIGL